MDKTINPDIEAAVNKLKIQATAYDKASNYYDGTHELRFASEKFKNTFGSLFKEFALNLCPAVVDAVKDKLVINGFRVEEGSPTAPVDAWKIWQDNSMTNRAGEVHTEAVKNGDAYVIVWPNKEGEVTIYPNEARSCAVFYDEETPGKIMWAAKYWTTKEKLIRLNLYYPDRTEKYISGKKSENGSLPEAKDFQQFSTDGNFNVPNPYGIVPVFHFANNGRLGSYGQSELKSAIPVQDALNKSVLDMLVAMEFQSYRQRWATGIEVEYGEDGQPIPPFKAGVDHLWLTESDTAKFGDFESAGLEPFLKVKDSFRIDLACVTGTPIYYFIQTEGDFPSGEALKKAETRFVKKVGNRQGMFGEVWEKVIAFALKIEKRGEDVRLFVDWEDPSPISEKEKLENIVIKKELGLDDYQALIEAGYGEADIKKILDRKAADRERLIKGFNAGEVDPANSPGDE
jgi:hypothetical protein